jgi:hypothetical protein
MKRAVLYSLISLVLLMILFFRFGFFYVNVSPHNTYWLNETEKQLIDKATLKFRERIENEKFDEILEDLTKGRQDAGGENTIIKEIQEEQSKLGKSNFWEIIRVAQPQLDNESGEKIYHVDCLSKYENEIYESFIWRIKNNNEINLIYSTTDHLSEATKWIIEERNNQKLITEQYPNEIIIPYADRYIEFRY